ncbi:MAG: bacillithiol biosynthesis BshC [Planctomycetes bacterium]|nr:bacillithiol biosynthesis BshC [Planctomycetota bacterium]
MHSDPANTIQLHQLLAQMGKQGKVTDAKEILGSENCLAVITGQQPNLLLGPTLILHKIFTAVSLSRWLKNNGINAVPVFWNASEDHDQGEILRTHQLSFDGNLRKLRLSSQQEGAVEALPWTAELSGLINELPDFSRSLFEGGYGDRYGDHFNVALKRLFEKDELVILEPRNLPDSEKFWQQVDEKAAEIVAGFEADEQDILAQGKTLQAPRRTAIPLFALDGKTGVRIPLIYENSQWSRKGEGKYSKSLFDLLRRGERFSPGALLRPALAQFHLPIMVSVLGPAEYEYHFQNERLFETLGLHRPVLWPRLKGTFLPQEMRSEIENCGIQVEEFLKSPVDHFQEWKIKQPDLLKGLESEMMSLKKNMRDSMPHHQGAMAEFERKMHGAFFALERKVKLEAWQAQGLPVKQLGQIARFLTPRSLPQERTLGSLFMLRDKEHFLQIQAQFDDVFDSSHRLYS